MVLSKLIKYTVLYSTLIHTPFALEYERKIKLPSLATKQSVSNIRFISKDGKYTYYQRRTGSLLLSTNYSVKEVLKGKNGTQYLVYSSPSRKKLIISQDQYFHNFYGTRKNLNLYVMKFGDLDAKKVGAGISPKLHNDDTWISYFVPGKKVLRFKSLESSALRFQIKLNNKINPYFVPQVVMTNEDEVYYTDLNNKGIPGIIKFNRKSKKSEVIYKGLASNEKFELCLNKDNFFLMEYGIDQSTRGTTISYTPRNKVDWGKRKIAYESKLNDTGSLHCSINKEKLYFIKNFMKEKLTLDEKEAFELDLNNKANTKLSNINYTTQLISMDQQLLVPFRNKFYVLLNDKKQSHLQELIKERKNKSSKQEVPKS